MDKLVHIKYSKVGCAYGTFTREARWDELALLALYVCSSWKSDVRL